MPKDAQERIKNCRGKAIWDEPFWGTLLLKMEPKEFSEYDIAVMKSFEMIPTMATDGTWIKYDPKFVDLLDDDELLFVLVHEVLHCMLMHQTRRMERDFQLWNIACDYAVNIMLVENNVGKIPTKIKIPDGEEFNCIPADQKYKDKTAEQIYDDLYKHADKIKMSIRVGKGGRGDQGSSIALPGVVMDHDQDGNGTSKEQEETTWKQNIADAVAIAKHACNLPGNLERWVDSWITPKTDWKQVLADWVSERLPSEYCWLRKNKRIPYPYLPGRDGWTIGNLVIAIDTSGSIGDEELRKFLGAVEELRNCCKCTVDMISIDTQVGGHKHYTEEQSIRDYKPVGGGGTDFAPAFQWVEDKLKVKPAGLIYFTDMYGSFPSRHPDYKTLWVTWTPEWNEGVPFGELLIMKD